MYHLNGALRLGVYEKAMPAGLDWEHKIQAAKTLGFDFIEMSVDESDERLQRLDWGDEAIFRMRRLCEHYGMPVHSLCLSAHRRFPFGSADASVRAQAGDIMRKAIELAYKLGVRCIQLAGYDVYYEPHSDATHQRFIDGMRESARLAERAGIMLGVEIMDTPYLNSLCKFEVLKKAVPSPYFMAYPDVGNITGWNYDVCTELQMSGEHIVQIHLKDTLRVSAGHPGQFRDLCIGEGQVDFPAIFRTLAGMNYSAPLVVEMWAQDAHWEDHLRRAKARLATMAQEAGLALG